MEMIVIGIYYLNTNIVGHNQINYESSSCFVLSQNQNTLCSDKAIHNQQIKKNKTPRKLIFYCPRKDPPTWLVCLLSSYYILQIYFTYIRGISYKYVSCTQYTLTLAHAYVYITRQNRFLLLYISLHVNLFISLYMILLLKSLKDQLNQYMFAQIYYGAKACQPHVYE